MVIPVKITNKYRILNRKAFKTIIVLVKDSLEISPGDSIVLNPNDPTVLEIVKNKSFVPYFPYNND